MKIRFTLTATCFLLITAVFGQNCEDSERYVTPMEGVIGRQQIDFATVTDYTNQNRTLRAHVYSLTGDTVSNRPLIILAHGGSFLFGSKNDMKSQCEELASLGYVCASIDYRLYPILLGLPDSAKMVDIAFNAISDMRAAVRHFKADADRGNTFRINPNNIIAGGYSAGAIMAMHVGILDENDPLTPEFEAFLAAKGGVEGNVGDSINQSYSSSVAAVMNLSGALFSLDWIDDNDPIIMSMHGDADNTVPFGTGREGAFNLLTLNGSSVIHERALQQGLESYLRPVPGGGHSDIYGAAFASFYEEFKSESQRMMRIITCEPSSHIAELGSNFEIQVYPNPAMQHFGVYFSNPISGSYSLVDMMGQRVLGGTLEQAQTLSLQQGPLAPGIYHIIVETTQGVRQTRKICLF